MKKECVEDYNKIKISQVSVLSSNKNLSDYEKDLKLKYARYNKYESDLFTFRLTDTRCNLGGWRLWFVCDECNNRVGTLFYRDYKLEPKCRNCLNLTYEARQKKGSWIFPIGNRVIKLKERYDHVTEKLKEKGIHAKTCFRLYLERAELIEKLNEALSFQEEV